MPPGVPPELAATARETLSGAVTAAAQLPGPVGSALLLAARQSFAQALQLNAVIGMVGFIALATLVATLLRHVPAHTEPESEDEGKPERIERKPTARRQPEALSGD
jgi:DHA2 family multidrug resistance protein-like MFS transporter